MKNREKRRSNYSRLIAVGYNSKQANQYKDLKESKIIKLIEARQQFNEAAKSIHGGNKNE